MGEDGGRRRRIWRRREWGRTKPQNNGKNVENFFFQANAKFKTQINPQKLVKKNYITMQNSNIFLIIIISTY